MGAPVGRSVSISIREPNCQDNVTCQKFFTADLFNPNPPPNNTSR